MKDIIVRTINKYQTEVVVEGRRVVLTDMKKVNAAKAKRRRVGDAIINTVLVIAFSMLMFWGIWLFFTHDEGHWDNGLKHGNGLLTCDKLTYNGNWSNGNIEGLGKMTWDNGNIYVGNFKDNHISGNGYMIWFNLYE